MWAPRGGRHYGMACCASPGQRKGKRQARLSPAPAPPVFVILTKKTKLKSATGKFAPTVKTDDGENAAPIPEGTRAALYCDPIKPRLADDSTSLGPDGTTTGPFVGDVPVKKDHPSKKAGEPPTPWAKIKVDLGGEELIGWVEEKVLGPDEMMGGA